ncbi:MAG TPA: adenylate/guanylate cyclase domain-containing protein, partial [Stellaceae bacterium]
NQPNKKRKLRPCCAKLETMTSRERVERRLAAVLMADVAGYSRLMGEDEEGTHAALSALRREVSDPKIAEHRGRIVKTTGDGLLVEFASAVNAVRCAVELQREMALRNDGVPKERRIEFRIGINLGDIIIDEHDIYGDGVNVAARLEALAEPGGICVSRVVRDQVRDKVDFGFEDLGEQQVKNIARPIRVYRIRIAEPAVEKPPLPLPEKPSLAVLPFQNMTGDSEQDYFVDGIVEEITTAISRLPWLFVIARNSSFTYKGRAVDVKQVARELGVRYVLEGSVRKAGNRVRITGQLIDTASGAHIWADRFDGALDDIFELQDHAASSVVGAIEPKIRSSEIERAIRKPTDSLDAWDLYLRALALRHKYTDESMREAIVLLKRALAIDPHYAPAAAMIGWCLVHSRANTGSPVSDPEAAAAVVLARQAIEAANDDPDTLWMAGWTLALFTGEYAASARIIDRALSLNANSAHAWMANGFVSCRRGRADSAIEAFQRAMRLSPLDPLNRGFMGGLAVAHLIARRYQEAVEWADQSLATQPDYRPALRVKVAALVQLGRIDKARDWLKRLIEVQPGLTITRIEAYAGALYSPELLAVFVDGFRKAGLPEE